MAWIEPNRPRSGGAFENNAFHLVFEDGGVLVAEQITTSAEATLSGLAQVLGRVEETAQLRYLAESEVGVTVLTENNYRYRELVEASSPDRGTNRRRLDNYPTLRTRRASSPLSGVKTIEIPLVIDGDGATPALPPTRVRI